MYDVLKQLVCELDTLLNENEYLRKENEYLNDKVENYEKDLRDRVDKGNQLIGELLSGLIK